MCPKASNPNYDEMCELVEFVVPWAIGLEWSEGKCARFIRDIAVEKNWDAKQLTVVFYRMLIRVSPNAPRRSPIKFDEASDVPIAETFAEFLTRQNKN